jgi:phosphoribosylamine-glycine ligase
MQGIKQHLQAGTDEIEMIAVMCKPRQSIEEAVEYSRRPTIVIEERLDGDEFSFQFFL